jgi:hypothetical protein
MFYNYAQFKKATKILLEEMKAEPFKLSGLRLRLVQLMGFSTVEAYEATFNREAPKTITVITIAPQQNVSKKDFTANDEGDKKAEAYFVEKILEIEPDMDESEIECFLEDGYYSKKGSDYEFYIVHNDD